MMDLIEEIESYSPQTGQPKPSVYYNNQSQNVKPPEDHLPTNSQPYQGGEEMKPETQDQPTGCTRFFKMKFYQAFFRITEVDIIQRIKSAVIPPYSSQFLEKIKPNPDFYGPFWIILTIVFLLGSVGNFSNYILSKFSSSEVWNGYFFKLQLVRYALVELFSFGLGVPGTLFLMLKIFSHNKISLPELICTYGYSLSCCIPALLLCILPLNFLHWILMIYVLANSSLFLIVSLRNEIEGIKVKHAFIFGVIIGLQLILILSFKLVFLDLL